MEARALLAVVLTLMILLFYQYMFFRPNEKKEPVNKQASSGETFKKKKFEAVKKNNEDKKGNDGEEIKRFEDNSIWAEENKKAYEIKRSLRLENSQVEAEVLQNNGDLFTWELTNYKKTKEKNSELIDLTQAKNEKFSPLTVRFIKAGEEAVPECIFAEIQQKDKNIKQITGRNGDLQITKTMSFFKRNYSLDYEIKVKNLGLKEEPGELIIAMAFFYPLKERSSYYVYGPMAKMEGKIIRQQESKIKEKEFLGQGQIGWLGFEDKFFAMIMKDPQNRFAQMSVKRIGNETIGITYKIPNLKIPPGKELAWNYNFFLGPKDLSILKAEGLNEVVNFGWFDIIARPLLVTLKFFYKYSGNYGIAIIILTIIIKLAFYPLSQKSFKSMQKMQKIQPKIVELREKYKNDRAKMTQELMQLYKTYKVSPMGGCLPMLVQIPVFIALYKILLQAIEIRHAPFMLWINDLSVKDPYYISPIIMGALMFIQQRMSPKPADPAQAKVMMVMPIFMTVLFLNFPSGLVIYWLVNNLLTIIQMYFVYRTEE